MLENILEGCGLVATFFGSMFEGEVSMITSAIGAKMGYYSIYLAILLGFAGAYIADVFKFFVSKSQGKKILAKRPGLQVKMDNMSQWFDKYPFIILTFYKLFFGTTTVIILLAGLKGVSNIRFAFHSAISVALWAILLGSFAYYNGESMLAKLEVIGMCKLQILTVISTAIFVYWLAMKRPFMSYCYSCAS